MAINWTEAQVAELVAKVVAEMRADTSPENVNSCFITSKILPNVSLPVPT